MAWDASITYGHSAAASNAAIIRSVARAHAAMNRAFFDGNRRKTYGCETPARLAMSSVVVPCRPRRENSATAARTTCSRRASALIRGLTATPATVGGRRSGRGRRRTPPGGRVVLHLRGRTPPRAPSIVLLRALARNRSGGWIKFRGHLRAPQPDAAAFVDSCQRYASRRTSVAGVTTGRHGIRCQL